jgi:antitoxin MazE
MILKPKVGVRKGWENSFQKMHENGDDKALMGDALEEREL